MKRKQITHTAHIAWQIRLGLDNEHLTNQEQLEVANHLIKQIKEDEVNDEKIDVIYRGSVVKGNSVEFTLEVDDLPDADKAKKLLDARFSASNRVSIVDVLAVYLYIRAENRRTEDRARD